MQSTQFQSLYQQLQTDFVLCFGARSSFSASRHHTTRDGLRKACILLHLQCLGNLMQSDANSIINDLISGLIKGEIYGKPPFPVNFPLNHSNDLNNMIISSSHDSLQQPVTCQLDIVFSSVDWFCHWKNQRGT